MTLGTYPFTDNLFGEDPTDLAYIVIPEFIDDLQRSDVGIVTALELTVANKNTPTVPVKFYFATLGFTTASGASPGNQYFAPLIQGCVIRRAVPPASDGELAGGLIEVTGEIIFRNSAGEMDDLVINYYADGRTCKLKAAGYSSSSSRLEIKDYGQFGVVFTGINGVWQVQGDTVRLTLTGLQGFARNYSPTKLKPGFRGRLQKPIGTRPYSGHGGQGGPVDLAELSKPQSYGKPKNISPQLVDVTRQIYQFHDEAATQVFNVWDRGISLHYDGRDFQTYEGLSEADNIEPGQYSTYLKLGMFRLGEDPAGQITANVWGDKTANRYNTPVAWSDNSPWSDGSGWAEFASRVPAETTSQVIWRMLEDRVAFGPLEINESSFRRFDYTQPGQIGFYIPTGDSRLVEEVIGQIAAAAGAVVGPDQYGKMVIIRLEKPDLYSPYTLVGNDTGSGFPGNILDMQIENLPYGLPPTTWKLKYRPNYTLQTASDLAGAVDPDWRISVGRAGPVTSSTNALISQAHPGAGEMQPETFFYDETVATAERQRRESMYTLSRRMIRVLAKTVMFKVEIGETVSVEYNRLGLDNWHGICLEVREDLVAQTTELLLWG